MDRVKKIIKISIISIVINFILAIFKAIIGLIVNSIAIILDAVNNLTDSISSIATIIGTKLANRAPDKKHPFGHGRVEYLTSVIVSFLVFITGIMALRESIIKIINPDMSNYSIISLIIISVAVITKFILGKYVKNKGKELSSGGLIASGQDALMDGILSLATLISAIINYIFKLSLEGYIGVIISLFIVKSAIDMLRETINYMIGVRTDKELTDKIKNKISSYHEVNGVYDLAIHNYGPMKSIGSVHIEVRDDMKAFDIHILTKTIEVALFNEFGIIMTIGIYARNDDKKYLSIKQDLEKITKSYQDIKQIHGFFVDDKNNDIYFDLIIDFECNDRKKISNEIIEKLQNKYPKYKFNVIIDDDITDL